MLIRLSFLLFSNVWRLIFVRDSEILSSRPLRLQMKRMARFWIISIVWIWALEQGSQTADPYSSMGRHSAVYARSLLLRLYVSYYQDVIVSSNLDNE
jgi:hypothetical protein